VPETKEEFAVELQNVTKRYRSGDIYIDVLRGIDLKAKKGELLMITGPSGCGKTTLLSVIAGTLHFDSGEVYVFNVKLSTLTDQEITAFRRNHVGFIFQQFHLILSLNVVENVAVPLLLQGYPREEALTRAAGMLKKVGLKGKEKLNPHRLSGGEQQRVAIARALVHDPLLIICDEPTSALDADNGIRIMQLLTDVAKAPNRCAIVVTHDPRIFRYADTIAHMEDGVIVGYGVD
jgi:putative ABC transport system ATP-binding protein